MRQITKLNLDELKQIYKAHHMNKLKWLTIELERVNETEIKNLIDMSFELTDRKLPKKHETHC